MQNSAGQATFAADRPGPVDAQQGEQAPVARAEVKDAPRLARHLVEQNALALGLVGKRVGVGEVAVDVLALRPLVSGHDYMVNYPTLSSKRVESCPSMKRDHPA